MTAIGACERALAALPRRHRNALTRRRFPAESGAAEGRDLGRARENMMAKVRSALLLASALALGACGTTQGDRAASGAAIGGGTGGLIGLAFGGVGVGAGIFVGAAIGAGTGALTTPRQVDLGKPIWR
jgi:osmotically inducible lipoprotein OsmB